MNRPVSQIVHQLHALHGLKFDFSTDGVRKLEDTLKNLAALPFTRPALYKKYYTELLFILAYPANRSIHDRASDEFRRIKIGLDENRKMALQLSNSGLPGVPVTGSFSHHLVKDLFTHDPDSVNLHSIDGEPEAIIQLLNHSLSGIEKEMLSEEKLPWKKWLPLFGGRSKTEQLSFLLRQTQRSYHSIEQRESVFACLKLFVTLNPGYDITRFTRTTDPQQSTYYYPRGLMRSFKKELFRSPENPFHPVAVSAAEKKALVSIARATLYPLCKETDPFTFASINETEYFTGPHGTGIALYYMLPEKKLALESYCGYLLFRNNIPVAYGGGWLLGQQCRFGLNILPAFRGGESFFIAQSLLQLYATHFNVQAFIIEPFQLGKGNPDGIRSGAFWFYYRMGFRPVQKELARLANIEFGKLRSGKTSRTAIAELKKLSQSVMCTGNKEVKLIHINTLSDAVSDYLKNHFQNDRELAEKMTTKRGRAFEPALINAMADETLRLDQKEMNEINKLFILKRRNERGYILSLQKHPAFIRILAALAGKIN